MRATPTLEAMGGREVSAGWGWGRGQVHWWLAVECGQVSAMPEPQSPHHYSGDTTTRLSG